MGKSRYGVGELLAVVAGIGLGYGSVLLVGTWLFFDEPEQECAERAVAPVDVCVDGLAAPLVVTRML